MKISVTGKQIDVGAALQDYVESNLAGSVGKYFDRAINAEVVFSKQRNMFIVDILVNEGTGAGITIKGQAREDDVHASFDRALERIETQLRRYKRRIKNHHKAKPAGIETELPVSAIKYVITEKDEVEEAPEQEEEAPLIIAEKPTSIETLTVSEAVMRMNLADLPALMFINKQNGCVNVVYHRKDGNVSWVNTQIRQASAA
ncbi:MAG: ribosome-associated translation inhibitor RaiA [Hyphomicrobiales bacterium]|nr:ribosome-associated translation inhibitor RaiA [Rickettsiales bacterium]MCP5361940.1 ribosome-associated translation inhibitor RaiA [Hyphomicrobiales bacterium]